MEFLGRLQALFTALLGDSQLAQWGVVLLLGLAVFVLLLALVLLAAGIADPLRRRLRQIEAQPAEASGSAGGPVDLAASFRDLVDPMGKRLMPTQEEARNKAFVRLRHAGYRSPGALNTFYGAKLGLTLLLPTLAMLVATFLGAPLDVAMLSAVAATLLGYLLPTYWLEKAIKRRTLALRRALPDALDLLVVCCEAGLGLGAAIQRVAQDLEISHVELSDEFKLFGMQTRAGMDTRSALRDLEERSGVDDIRGLVTSLLQSMRFGTSIAATLRIYAAELRDKRTQEAEEMAAKVSTKMLFPLIFCVFPSFFVVALGPPLLGAMEALAGR